MVPVSSIHCGQCRATRSVCTIRASFDTAVPRRLDPDTQTRLFFSSPRLASRPAGLSERVQGGRRNRSPSTCWPSTPPSPSAASASSSPVTLFRLGPGYSRHVVEPPARLKSGRSVSGLVNCMQLELVPPSTQNLCVPVGGLCPSLSCRPPSICVCVCVISPKPRFPDLELRRPRRSLRDSSTTTTLVAPALSRGFPLRKSHCHREVARHWAQVSCRRTLSSSVGRPWLSLVFPGFFDLLLPQHHAARRRSLHH